MLFNYRFRVFVLVNDTTSATNVILLDRVVKCIVGSTMANISNEIKKVMEYFEKCCFGLHFYGWLDVMMYFLMIQGWFCKCHGRCL